LVRFERIALSPDVARLLEEEDAILLVRAVMICLRTLEDEVPYMGKAEETSPPSRRW